MIFKFYSIIILNNATIFNFNLTSFYLFLNCNSWLFDVYFFLAIFILQWNALWTLYYLQEILVLKYAFLNILFSFLSVRSVVNCLFVKIINVNENDSFNVFYEGMKYFKIHLFAYNLKYFFFILIFKHLIKFLKWLAVYFMLFVSVNQ